MGIFGWLRGGVEKKQAETEAFRAARRVLREHNSRRRSYDAASSSPRTQGWRRHGGDAVTSASAHKTLRNISRDLVRNNSWAKSALQIIAGNTVGWGIIPRGLPDPIAEAWRKWAKSTACDVRGQLTFYGLQSLAIRTIVQSGAVLIVRHMSGSKELGALQLSVLEPDYIDTSKSDIVTPETGNRTKHGIEFDRYGRRVAYWLFDQHPGGEGFLMNSKRVPADDVLHVYHVERPEQIHGIPWYCTAIVKLKDFDEYSDAQLLRQKIAACFAAFVRDTAGDGSPIGLGGDGEEDDDVDKLEPGMIHTLPPGKDITFATPPGTGAGDAEFSRGQLREIASGLGVTYEDLTGDFSGANYSTLRAGRLKHFSNVHEWRWSMLVPMMLDPVMAWFVESLSLAQEVQSFVHEWTPPPTALIDPEKEGPAYRRLIRAGLMTPSEAVAEMGNDPRSFFKSFSEDLKELDRLGIVLDCDPRQVSDTGQAQVKPSSATEKNTPAAGK